MKTIGFLILLQLVTGIALAQNKLTYQLSDFDININIDTDTWRRVSYSEAKQIAEKNKFDLDEYLKEQKFIAAFHFIPKDSLSYPPATFISIEVLPAEYKSKIVTTIDSSLHLGDRDSFLLNMQGGSIEKGLDKYYFDRYTGSILFKFLTYMSVKKEDSGKWSQYTRLPDHYFIEQSKSINGRHIKVQYYCYESEKEIYFPKFERIIKTFQ